MPPFCWTARDGTVQGDGFRLELRPYAECLGTAPLTDQKAFYKACGEAFGQNTHVAGSLAEDGGCLVVMRSDREDDPSKPNITVAFLYEDERIVRRLGERVAKGTRR